MVLTSTLKPTPNTHQLHSHHQTKCSLTHNNAPDNKMTPLPLKPSLLLLPSPPQPPTFLSLHAAYHPALSAVLPRLQSSDILVIALAAPFIPPRWHSSQTLLARLYSLIAAFGPDFDVRVVLVDHIPGRQYPPDRSSPFNNTTILDLADFALKKQRWGNVYHASSEAGYELLNTFLKVAERSQTFLQSQLIPLPGGLSLTTEASRGDSDELFRTVCLGGTFDHLHAGHKLLLHAATLLLQLPRASEKPAVLIIGISGDALLKNKKYATELEPWPVRVQSILFFLSTILSSPIPAPEYKTIGDNEEICTLFCSDKVLVRCVNIPDPFGPTVTEVDIDVIVVSGETRGGGAAINDKRVEKGWPGLHVFEIDVLNVGGDGDGVKTAVPDDFTAKISSTEIRRRRAEARKTDHPTS